MNCQVTVEKVEMNDATVDPFLVIKQSGTQLHDGKINLKEGKTKTFNVTLTSLEDKVINVQAFNTDPKNKNLAAYKYITGLALCPKGEKTHVISLDANKE